MAFLWNSYRHVRGNETIRRPELYEQGTTTRNDTHARQLYRHVQGNETIRRPELYERGTTTRNDPHARPTTKAMRVGRGRFIPWCRERGQHHHLVSPTAIETEKSCKFDPERPGACAICPPTDVTLREYMAKRTSRV